MAEHNGWGCGRAGPEAKVDYLQDELKRANDQLDQNSATRRGQDSAACALRRRWPRPEERIVEWRTRSGHSASGNKASLTLVSLNKKGAM